MRDENTHLSSQLIQLIRLKFGTKCDKVVKVIEVLCTLSSDLTFSWPCRAIARSLSSRASFSSDALRLQMRCKSGYFTFVMLEGNFRVNVIHSSFVLEVVVPEDLKLNNQSSTLTSRGTKSTNQSSTLTSHGRKSTDKDKLPQKRGNNFYLYLHF